MTEITTTTGIMGGSPCLDGTRIPASQVEVYMRDGATEDEMRADYPTLPVGAFDAVRRWRATAEVDQ